MSTNRCTRHSIACPVPHSIPELNLGVHVQIEVTTEHLSHDKFERNANEFQRVLELNTMIFDLYLLVLGGWNDFEVSGHRRNKFHDECEVTVRSIVEIHWQSIVLLVERELEISFGTTGADILSSLEETGLSGIRILTCHMCEMFHLIVLQFLAAEWTHRHRLIISLDFGSVLEGKFIEEILLHVFLQSNQIVHERTKIAFFLVW